MAIAFVTSNSKMPGLNFEAPPGIRDLEYLFDQIFASEQRTRLQLTMGQYRDEGASYGVVDQQNPNSAIPKSGRPLCVQPNDGNPLTLDIMPGAAITKAGNVIVVPEQVFGVALANNAVVNVVLLEYVVIDNTDTNVVTDGNTVEAVRRTIALPVDPDLPSSTPETQADPDLNKAQLLKVVTLQDYQDLSKFSQMRLNDVVVLAIVQVVSNPSPPPLTILSIDMTNAVNTYVRPWFSAVDQEHRAFVGTGSPLVPHALGYNDLSGGALTLYQQLLQHGMIISRDINVPGCPGKYCTELVDVARVFTDTDGSVTGAATSRYVRLNSYPNRIIGARANTLNGSDIVEDKSLGAQIVAVELIPNTNILKLGYQDGTFVNEIFDILVGPTHVGFTVYYTDSDCLRPPALPQDLMLVANDIIQFQKPTPIEEYVTGGKIFNELPNTQYAVGTNGPVPKNYRLVLDASQQFVECPQVVQCARLINASTGVGTAVQAPQFVMYGPARIRLALWNATPQPNLTLNVQVELAGKDLTGATVTETVIFSGTAGTAQPAQIAWDQPLVIPDSGEISTVFQLSNTVFTTLDTWKVKQTPVAAGANALIQLWAELEPTTTPSIDDTLPICTFNWNGQSVARIRDERPIDRKIQDVQGVLREQSDSYLISGNATHPYVALLGESFKDPRFQDNILSKRNRHSGLLNSAFTNETLPSFAADGSCGREWYYSQAIVLPQQAGTDALNMVVFGDSSHTSILTTFGSDMVVEYQVAFVSTPGVFSGWSSMPGITGSRSFKLNVANVFKIRFRIAGKKLAGYSLAIAQ